MTPLNPPTYSADRAANGQFLPGSGGRLPGSKNRVSSAALQAVKDMSSEAVQGLRIRVRAGELAAIVYVLDRVLPKGRTVELLSTDPLAISDAVAAGELTASEAKELAAALASLRDLAEIDDLRARIDELERAVAK